MTLDEVNIALVQAEVEKAKAHARLMNAQAEKLELENVSQKKRQNL